MATWGGAAALLLVLQPVAARAAPLTLAEALAEARAANARLPVAAAGLAAARARLEAARAARWSRFSVDGDLRYAPPGASYAASQNVNNERLQLVLRQPLYQGGELAAGIAGRAADVDAATARRRIAEKDIDLAVRELFAAFDKTRTEIAFRSDGIVRLEAYLVVVEERRAAGEGVEADLLRTRVRLAGERANMADAMRRLDEARVALDNVLGRDPALPLDPAAPPPPSPPAVVEDAPWRLTPELREAFAGIAAAHADVTAARAGRRPHLDLNADVGWLGNGISADPTDAFDARLHNDFGFSVELALHWDVLDMGLYAARVAAARAAVAQADAEATVALRGARVAWRKADVDLADLWRVVAARQAAVPTARDAYLAVESIYRGGAGSALEVLAAYGAWIDAQESLAEAIEAYRNAEAELERWGSP